MSEFKAKTEHINYALLVDPEMTYPVSYYILPNGAKQLCPTVAKGKDLTENQIKELIEKKIVHVGYVPISIYTTTRAELESVKAELDRGKELLKSAEMKLKIAGIDQQLKFADKINEYLNPAPPQKN